MPAVPHPLSLLRVVGVSLCCLALVTVLGGGSSCSWSSNHSSNNDDDDFNDDDNNFTAPPENGSGQDTGFGGLIVSPGLIQQGLAELHEHRLAGARGVGRHGRTPGMDQTSGTGWDGAFDGSFEADALGDGSAHLTDFGVDFESRAGRHPIARLRDIRGLSVFSVAPEGVVGSEHFERFTTLVMAENPDLLSLPPAAGHLRFNSVTFLDQIIAVVHEQVPGTAGDPHAAALSVAGQPAEMIFVFDLLGRLVQIENRTRLPPGVVATVPEDLATR